MTDEMPTWGDRPPDHISEEEGATQYMWVDEDDEVVFTRTVYERGRNR